MKTAAFVLKRDTPKALTVATHVAAALAARGVAVIYGDDGPALPHGSPMAADSLGALADCVIVVGGDGTFLAAAARLHGLATPIIGINLGRVGFLTEVEADNVNKLVDDLLNNAYACEPRPFFVARFGGVEQPFLNDAVLQRDAHEKMIEYAVDVGGKYMTAGKADGLIVASPTGSTAYNLSTGGPIVYPTVESLVLAPIAPHKLSFRPVVIPADEVVVTLRSPQAHLSLDGRANGVLKVGDKLIIRRSPHSLNLLHDAKRNFFDLLRLKLGWDLPAGLQ